MANKEVSKVELAQLFDIICFGSSMTNIGSIAVQSVDDINQKLFLYVVKYSPEYAALAAEFHRNNISEVKFRDMRKILFHKLAGQYSAALQILQASVPFDGNYFKLLIVMDPARKAIFELFQKDKMPARDYLLADKICISELIPIYGQEILRRAEAGEAIYDKTSLVT